MRSLFLFGYFGDGNLGDSWFLKYYLKKYSANHPNIYVYVKNAHARNVQKQTFNEYTNVRFVSSLGLLWRQLVSGKKSKVAILGGDQLVTLTKSKVLILLLLIAKLKRMFVYGLGTSIDDSDFVTDFLYRFLLKGGRVRIFPRDRRRSKVLGNNVWWQIEDIGVKYLKENYSHLNEKKSSQYDFFVNIKNIHQYEDFVLKNQKYIDDSPLRIAISSFCKLDELATSKASNLLKERGHQVDLFSFENEEGILRAISCSDRVYVIRLHAMLATTFFGKKVQTDFYDNKCRYYSEMISE